MEDEALEWRKAIRKVARDLGWTIRTGFQHDQSFVWAARLDFDFQDPQVHEEFTMMFLDAQTGHGDE